MSMVPVPYATVGRFFPHPVAHRHKQYGDIYPETITVPAWVFYGQQGEDLDVFVDFFRDKPIDKGVFVEVGAGNGIEFSNTHFFEKCLKWTGVLIEPNHDHEDFLHDIRQGSHIEMCVAGKEEGEASFAVHPYIWAQSHRTDVNSPELQTTLGQNMPLINVTVPVRPLGDILRDAHVSYIDFLSIDVEGSELEVLEGMDWDIPVHVIVIECTDGVCENTATRVKACRSILKEQGFTFHKTLGCNEVWKNEAFPAERDKYL